MTDDMILDIPENNIGVDCIGIDHGFQPIEDSPVYTNTPKRPAIPKNDTITTFVPVEGNETEKITTENPKKPQVKEKGIWRFCAKTSFTLGIIGMVGSFVPFVQVFTALASILGFFLSLFGKKARSVRAKNIVGRIFNIVAVALTILMFAFYATELGLY